MDTAKTPFEEAMIRFRTRLTAQEQKDFEFTTLDHVRDAVLCIQRRHEQTKTMRNLARIQGFLEAMGQFAKVIEVFLNVSSVLCFVWGPIKFLLLTAQNWAESYDTLLGAYEKIGNHIPQLQQYQSLFNQNERMRLVLAFIYEDILEFHRCALRFFSGNGWQKLFRSSWKHFETRFSGILDRLRHHKESIVDEARLLHLHDFQADSQALRDHIQDYQQEKRQMQEQLRQYQEVQVNAIEKLEEHRYYRNYRAVLEWLSAASAAADHEVLCKTRSKYAGTGSWILRHETVQNWKDTEVPVSAVLWLNGIPGAGKTILASVLVDSCIDMKGVATAFFYCKEDDPQRNNCISILRGLTSQLLGSCSDVLPFCYEKAITSGELSLNTVPMAGQILELILDRVPKTIIIIDGLDECESKERAQVLSLLKKLVTRCESREPGKVRILFISQDLADISRELKTESILPISLMDIQNDIDKYVHQKALKLKLDFELDEIQVEHIRKLTCERARGMFLFAKLVMKNLSRQLNKQTLLDEINEYNFPLGLEQAYERILRRVKRTLTTKEWMVSQKLLGWVICAKRTFKWHEIQAAISIDVENETVAFKTRKLKKHIRELCGSLIRILHEDRVEIIHATAKIYIKQTGYVYQPAVECNLATLCMHYLTFPFLDSTNKSILSNYARDGVFLFQDYAVGKWFHHIKAVIQDGSNLLTPHPIHQPDIRNFLVAMDEFVTTYQDWISNAEPSMQALNDCESFRDQDFYDYLVLVWNHVLQHQGRGPTARNEISIEPLSKAFFRNRSIIEDLSSVDENIKQLYGHKPFKCSKLTCFYFHEGFEDAKTRQQHLKRHDRPFSCTFEGCTSETLGFINSKDLEKHNRTYHPESANEELTFYTPEKPPAGPLRYHCDLCNKQFTRNIHLKSHQLNHSGDRPFSCEECGKAFTRINDCRRHRKIHARR